MKIIYVLVLLFQSPGATPDTVRLWHDPTLAEYSTLKLCTDVGEAARRGNKHKDFVGYMCVAKLPKAGKVM
jgi:hypothetical protein